MKRIAIVAALLSGCSGTTPTPTDKSPEPAAVAVSQSVTPAEPAEIKPEDLAKELPPMDLSSPKKPAIRWPKLPPEPATPVDPKSRPETAAKISEALGFDGVGVKRDGDVIEIRYTYREREASGFGLFSPEENMRAVMIEDAARILANWRLFIPEPAGRKLVTVHSYVVELDRLGNPGKQDRYFAARWIGDDVQNINYNTLSANQILSLAQYTVWHPRLRNESEADSK